jgi:hypothetical protein
MAQLARWDRPEGSESVDGLRKYAPSGNVLRRVPPRVLEGVRKTWRSGNGENARIRDHGKVFNTARIKAWAGEPGRDRPRYSHIGIGPRGESGLICAGIFPSAMMSLVKAQPVLQGW